MKCFVYLQFFIVATDQGVPSLSSAVRVTVLIRRNRNAPVFRLNEYEETITEFTSIGSSVLRVVADDADNVSLTHYFSSNVYAQYLPFQYKPSGKTAF